MRRVIFLVFLALLAPANAQIYKWVGPDGQVHFSDEPRAGAEVIVLPSVRPPREEVHAAAPQPAKTPVPSITVYRAVKVLEPDYGATIRDNQGIVDVVIAVDPELDTEAGDLVQILVDHRPFGEPSQTLEQELYGLDRGTHRIAVRVINKRGRTLISSAPVIVYLHREFRDRLEPAPHDRFAEVFLEEAGDELSPAERARLKHVTRDDFNELMDKLIPAFVERLDPQKREAFMKRLIGSIVAQLPPEEGERAIKRFMRRATWRLKPGERREFVQKMFTQKMVEVVNEYLEPVDDREPRFVTTEHQQEYWDRFVALIGDQLDPAERARLRHLANPEQRRAFMEGFVPPHLKRLEPRQQQKFIDQFVPMLAAQLPRDRGQDFIDTFVETRIQAVPPKKRGAFMRRFIKRSVDHERRRFVEKKGPDERAPWLGAIPRPEEPDETPGRKRKERWKGFADKTPPEESEGFYKGSPEERTERATGKPRPEGAEGYRQVTPKERGTLRKQARRDQGVERHPKQEGLVGSPPGRTRIQPGEVAPQPGFRTGAPQPVTPLPAAQPTPPGSRLGPLSASTGR